MHIFVANKPKLAAKKKHFAFKNTCSTNEKKPIPKWGTF